MAACTDGNNSGRGAASDVDTAALIARAREYARLYLQGWPDGTTGASTGYVLDALAAALEAAEARLTAATEALDVFFDGEPCGNDECREKGYCIDCVMRLEEARDAIAAVAEESS